jgi:antibiotic biosynthesis monooxygenase (ABM) superfamily enzyme
LNVETESKPNLKQTPIAGLPTALAIKLKLRPGVDAQFATWHAKMATGAADIEGFVSAEVNAPAAGTSEWQVIQRFRDNQQLGKWRASAACQNLLGEARSLVDTSSPQALREEEIAEGIVEGLVTEVVTTYVKPGKEKEYREWAEKIHGVEARFPGYRGGYLQPPASEYQRYWTTLVRFATPEQLDNWLNSEERKALLLEHQEIVKEWEHHRLPSSFAGWFPPDAKTGQSPASWKQSMLVVLMLFPIVVLELRFLTPLLSPILQGFPLAMGTFIGNVISVYLLSWPFMPIIIRAMKWWLLPTAEAPQWTAPAGVALLFGLYTMEIVVLSLLL